MAKESKNITKFYILTKIKIIGESESLNISQNFNFTKIIIKTEIFLITEYGNIKKKPSLSLRLCYTNLKNFFI